MHVNLRRELYRSRFGLTLEYGLFETGNLIFFFKNEFKVGVDYAVKNKVMEHTIGTHLTYLTA